jgi:hypothetical protein
MRLARDNAQLPVQSQLPRDLDGLHEKSVPLLHIGAWSEPDDPASPVPEFSGRRDLYLPPDSTVDHGTDPLSRRP